MGDPSLLICGVDEAGRGPLCGSVVAAAVILDPLRPIDGLADSKKLSAKRREALALLIRDRALAWSIAEATREEIDRLNILHATMLAMSRAVEGLAIAPTEVLVDGNRVPDCRVAARAIVKGDSLVPEISAASILAKTPSGCVVGGDGPMLPTIWFLPQHKGYPTAAHLRAIREFGLTPEHRRSFAPVRDIDAQASLF